MCVCIYIYIYFSVLFPSGERERINVTEEIWQIALWRTQAVAPNNKVPFSSYSLGRFRGKKQGLYKVERQKELISD